MGEGQGGLKQWGGGAKAMILFTKNPNLFFRGEGGREGGEGARLSDFFFTKNPNRI